MHYTTLVYIDGAGPGWFMYKWRLRLRNSGCLLTWPQKPICGGPTARARHQLYCTPRLNYAFIDFHFYLCTNYVLGHSQNKFTRNRRMKEFKPFNEKIYIYVYIVYNILFLPRKKHCEIRNRAMYQIAQSIKVFEQKILHFINFSKINHLEERSFA